MAILSREDYFNRLHERVGDDTSDEGISFLEDMTDTFNDLETRSTKDSEDWEKKYHDLDETWKKRYQHRFYSNPGTNVPDYSSANEDEKANEDITIKELFEPKED